MPRVTCRCGEILSVPADGPERMVCPKCSARIRIRRTGAPAGTAQGPSDGYLRFHCPCGRRLKVRIDAGAPIPESGKCPDCGRVVPVPNTATPTPSSSSSGALAAGHPESSTEELSITDLTNLEQWKQRRHAVAAVTLGGNPEGPESTAMIPLPSSPPEERANVEAGLRICPRCGKPVHLSGVVCRACGAHVPKR